MFTTIPVQLDVVEKAEQYLYKSTNMKTLMCVEPRKFQYEPREEPHLEPNHAIIKIKRIGVCGTDLHAFEGTQPYFEYPRILGHELSG